MNTSNNMNTGTMSTCSPSIPVTIVTGFLGAGKTTLLNKVAKLFGEFKRIAVIENEFGEVNLDAKMVSNQLKSKEDVVTISKGCVCCSLRKDILAALAELERRSEVNGAPYDHIILETTGLADPAPVAFTFFTNPWAKTRYHLGSIVTVVDAKYLRVHLSAASHGRTVPSEPSQQLSTEVQSEGANALGHSNKDNSHVNEVSNQIAFADTILLNKVDLVTGEEAMAVERELREINSLARVVHTRLNDDDYPNWLSTILSGDQFSLHRALEVDPRFLESATSGEDSESDDPEESEGKDGEPAEGQKAGDHTDAADGSDTRNNKRNVSTMTATCSHDKTVAPTIALAPRLHKRPRKATRILHDLGSVRSVCVMLPGQLDSYLFNMFMHDFLQEKGKDVFRSKGTLCVHGHKKYFNFQGVHETFQVAPCRVMSEHAHLNPHSELVFIGKNLNRDDIKQGLLSCLWRPLPPGWNEFLDKKTHRTYYVNEKTKEKTWVRPVHETEEEREEDLAAAAAVVNEGAERTLLQVASVEQPQNVRPSE